MLEFIRELCTIDGVSGNEDAVRELIISKLGDNCSYKVDNIGNLIVTHNGVEIEKKIAVFAHMDEVGLIITHVTDEGFLKFSVMGIDPKTLYARKIAIGDKKVVGCIGARAVHQVTEEDRTKEPVIADLIIDIGAMSREEALEHIAIGDYATFIEPFIELGEDFVSSKALDDRIGCAILLDLLNSDVSYSFTGVFSCMEEVGLFGATAAAAALTPDIGLILETTTAGDIDGATPDKTVCALGRGPVISFADKGTIYPRDIFKLAFDAAAQNNITVQTKEGVFGGNESRAVMTSGGGAKVCALSVPCRYLHSASCVAKKGDILDTRKMAFILLDKFSKL